MHGGYRESDVRLPSIYTASTGLEHPPCILGQGLQKIRFSGEPEPQLVEPGIANDRTLFKYNAF